MQASCHDASVRQVREHGKRLWTSETFPLLATPSPQKTLEKRQLVDFLYRKAMHQEAFALSAVRFHRLHTATYADEGQATIAWSAFYHTKSKQGDSTRKTAPACALKLGAMQRTVSSLDSVTARVCGGWLVAANTSCSLDASTPLGNATTRTQPLSEEPQYWFCVAAHPNCPWANKTR